MTLRPEMERRTCACGCLKTFATAKTSPSRYFAKTHEPGGFMRANNTPPKKRGRKANPILEKMVRCTMHLTAREAAKKLFEAGFKMRSGKIFAEGYIATLRGRFRDGAADARGAGGGKVPAAKA